LGRLPTKFTGPKRANRQGAGTISAGLLALCLLLGVTELATAQQQQDPVTIAADPQRFISLDRLSATRDRPLFSPSRRPPRVMLAAPAPPPPLPPPVVPAAPPSLTFFGTFESKDEVGANIQTGPNVSPTIVRYGSYVEGWRVTEISRHRLVLSRDDRTAVFTLFGPKGPGSQPTIDQRPPAAAPQARLDATAGQASNKGLVRKRTP
jgi:hypothetical protein